MTEDFNGQVIGQFLHGEGIFMGPLLITIGTVLQDNYDNRYLGKDSM